MAERYKSEFKIIVHLAKLLYAQAHQFAIVVAAVTAAAVAAVDCIGFD